jgi:hypothetical protein
LVHDARIMVCLGPRVVFQAEYLDANLGAGKRKRKECESIYDNETTGGRIPVAAIAVRGTEQSCQRVFEWSK